MNFDVTEAMMIALTVILLLCIFVGCCYHYESPIYLLKRSKVDKAINVMMKVRSETTLTADIRDDLKDYEKIIQESNNSSSSNIKKPTVFMIVLLKLAGVAAFNMNNSLLENTEISSVLLVVLILIRLVFAFIAATNWKKISTLKISCILSAIALLGTFTNIWLRYDNEIFSFVFSMLLQASSVSISGFADTMQVEAFDLRIKPLAIAIFSSFDFTLHLICISMFFFLNDFIIVMLTGTGGFLMFIALAMSMGLSDTIGLSLVDARFFWNLTI